MKTIKAAFVTVAMTAMLITILIGLFLLKLFVPLFIVVGLFASFGIVTGASKMLAWLQNTTDDSDGGKMLPVEPKKKSADVCETEHYDVDAIMTEYA